MIYLKKKSAKNEKLHNTECYKYTCTMRTYIKWTMCFQKFTKNNEKFDLELFDCFDL